MNLQPQASFTVVRQIGNHLDTDTNYVRAVIRNAYTDEIIDTLDLEDKGSQRFKKNWQVPADGSGQGFYISIVTSVYTDSGYTTKNDNYADEETTYLVQDRLMRLGGGGGISASDVRRVVADELEKRLEPLSGVYGALGTLQREVNRIPKEAPEPEDRTDEVLAAIKAVPQQIQFPQPEAVDLSALEAGQQRILDAVAQKEVTPEPDLTPVLSRLDEIDANNAQDKQEITSALEQLPSVIEEKLASVELNIAPTKAKTEKPKQPEPVPFDPSKLAL